MVFQVKLEARTYLVTPEVSIIIPCYNAAPWLQACIASTQQQGIDSMEIIVIDDGSQDESLQIAESLAGDTVRVLSQSNQGASRARNHGLQVAQGRFIQYLDADDLLGKYKISHQLERLKQAPAGTLATCSWVRFEGSIENNSVGNQDNFSDLSPLEFLQLNWEQDIMMHPAAWLIPREVADRAGPWDESLTLNDDGEYFCRIALASSGLAYTPDVITYYRSNLSSSLSGRKDATSLLSLHCSIEKMEALLLYHDSSAHTRHACACARQRLAYSIFSHHPELAAHSEQRARELSDLPLPKPGGGLTQKFATYVGWRNALRLQSLYIHMQRTIKGVTSTNRPPVSC